MIRKASMAGSIRNSLCVGSLAALVALLLCVGGFLGLLCGVSVIHCSPVKAARSMPDQISIPMPAPGRKGIVHNEYRCTSAPSQLSNGYIVQYEPRADPNLVHHMLVFGCQYPPRRGSWDCKSISFVCGIGDSPRVVFAWALNASGLHLPEDVGVRVGADAGINYLVVQIHYGDPADVHDMTTVSKETIVVHTTQQRQRYVASIYLLGSGDKLNSGSEEASVYTACKFRGPKVIYPFAFRTHAHSLGKQIVGYVVKPDNTWEVIGTRSPQDPQAFYPVQHPVTIDPSDWVAARCVFDTVHTHHLVHMGPNSENEMCNFYIMYYTTNDDVNLISNECWSHPPSSLHYPSKLPPLTAAPQEGEGEGEGGVHSHGESSTLPLATMPLSIPATSATPMTTHPTPPVTPSPPASESAPPTSTASPASNSSGGGLVLAEDWALNGFPIPAETLGQITGVAVDSSGGLHILHRGPITWDYDSFDADSQYRHRAKGPIEVAVLLKFSPSTGRPVHAWGNSLFYMPHGLTIDHEGSFWVTDVAMHQVFKFDSFDDSAPSLVLGKAFTPSSDYGCFCQPTSVAVEKSGVFYVADGYCNHRIMKFNKHGKLAEVWEAAVAGMQLFVPHKAILSAAENILYVADRENRRVLSFGTVFGGNGHVFSDRTKLGGYPYAIDLNGSASDWPMYGVFGGVSQRALRGFTLDKDGGMTDTWGPQEGFSRPHDLTVDTVHNAVYVTEIGPNRIWKFVPIPSPVTKLSQELENELDKVDHSTRQETVPTASPTHLPHPHSEPAKPLPSSDPTTKPLPPSDPTTKPLPPSDSPKPLPPSYSPKPLPPSGPDSTDSSLGQVSNTGSSEASVHAQREKKKPTVGVDVGVVVAVLAVVVLIALVVVGVLKEHRFIRFQGWRLLQAGDKEMTIGVKASGATTQREKEKLKKRKKKKKKLSPQKKLQGLLGPSHLGFSRLKTYDSNSEDEEFPVFNRV